MSENRQEVKGETEIVLNGNGELGMIVPLRKQKVRTIKVEGRNFVLHYEGGTTETVFDVKPEILKILEGHPYITILEGTNKRIIRETLVRVS